MNYLSNFYAKINSAYNSYFEMANYLMEKNTTSNEHAVKIVSRQAMEIKKEIEQVDQRNLSSKEVKLYQKAKQLCEELVDESAKLKDVFHHKVISDKPTSEEELAVKTFLVEQKGEDHLSSSLSKYIPGFINKYTSYLQGLPVGYIFRGYAKNEAGKTLPKKIEQMEKKRLFLEEQIQESENMLKTLAPESTSHSLLFSKLTSLKADLENLEQLIDTAKQKFDIFQKNQEKAAETRAQFQAVGGENIQLVTSDGVKLIATFLDAQVFKSKIKESGGKLVILKKMLSDGTIQQIQGISFKQSDIQANDQHLIHTLNQLTSLSDFTSDKPKLGSGWTKVIDEDNLVLVRNEHIVHIINSQTTDNDFIIFKPDTLSFSLSGKVEHDYEELNMAGRGGTVIISSGIEGVYEQHKVEALAFLFKGMNVMMANFRGYGQSEGIPSKNGLQKDLEAAYQYCKFKTDQPDDKILIKALCMSGGAGAHLAGQHPDINIMLDQTYSDFRKLTEEQVRDLIEDYVKGLEKDLDVDSASLKEHLTIWAGKHFSTLAGKAARCVAPGFETAKELAKNRGQKAILFVHDDEVISFPHVEENIKAIAKSGQMEYLTVFSAPGSHGTYWPHIFTQPYRFTDMGKEIKRMQKEAVEQKEKLQEQIAKIEQKLTKAIETHQAQLALSTDFIQVKIIQDEIEKLEQLAIQDINNLKKQMDQIDERTTQEMDKRLKDLDPGQVPGAYIGLALMDHFLYKAKLSDDIIKTPEQQKRQKDPQIRNLEQASQMIMKLAEDHRLLLDNFKKLNTTLIKLEVNKDFHTFTTIPVENLGFKFEKVKINNTSIQQLEKALDNAKEINKKLNDLEDAATKDELLSRRLAKNQNQLESIFKKIEAQYEQNNQKLMHKIDKEIYHSKQQSQMLSEQANKHAEHFNESFTLLLANPSKQAFQQAKDHLLTMQTFNEELNQTRQVLNQLENQLPQLYESHPHFSDSFKENISNQLVQMDFNIYKAFHSLDNLIQSKQQIVEGLNDIYSTIQQIEERRNDYGKEFDSLQQVLENISLGSMEEREQTSFKMNEQILNENLDKLGEEIQELISKFRQLKSDFNIKLNTFEALNEEEKVNVQTSFTNQIMSEGERLVQMRMNYNELYEKVMNLR